MSKQPFDLGNDRRKYLFNKKRAGRNVNLFRRADGLWQEKQRDKAEFRGSGNYKFIDYQRDKRRYKRYGADVATAPLLEDLIYGVARTIDMVQIEAISGRG
jgi:hypothetical protein